jgi:hypothetical protein
MFVEIYVNYSGCKQKLMSLRGQATLAKMTSLKGKPAALEYHLTKRVIKTEKLTYLCINIVQYIKQLI